MELKKEKNFPRGGRKPVLFKSNNRSSYSFFKKPIGKPKKKNKKVNQSGKKNVSEKAALKPMNDEFTVKFIEDLKPSIVQDEMLILGIVSKITERIVNVSLPGGLRGAITLANVSEFYRNLIENSFTSSEVPTLMEVFQIGDILPVKVIAASEKHHSLMLTSDPKLINQKLSYNLLEKNFILTGSVKSQEDHGFIIDFGIEHVNGFLKYEKVNANQNLKVGQLVRCCIIQCSISLDSCNVQLSVLKKDIQSAFINKDSALPVFCLIPGFQFKVTVKKILNQGVEVSCGQKDFLKGYIHEDHFLKKFSNPVDLKIGSKITATLLYIKPLVNFLYFKIMPKKELKWPFKFGEIVKGKVAKVRKTGVIFKVSDGSRKAKCFVPVSKLRSKVNLQENSEIFNLYSKNKIVPQIRLGNVDFMGRYYIGATDKGSIHEKYYSIFDLKCGDIVPCKIVSFGKSVARLEIGRTIKGIVAFTDMSDVPMRNPMSKFKLGQKLKARVTEIIPEKILVKLTMKPTLLKEKEILCDTDKCIKNKCYTGTVLKVVDDKLTIKFFNHIFGVIPKHLTFHFDSKSLTDYFCKGQLLKCYLVKVQSKNKVLLSLIQKNKDVQLTIGKKYSVKVLNITESGFFLDVIVDRSTKCTGYMPSTLLTQHQDLVPALHSTYFPGEEFSAYCVTYNSKIETHIFGSEEIFSIFFEGKSEEELQKLFTEEAVLPFLFKNKSFKTKSIYLNSIIPSKNDFSVVVISDDFSGSCPLLKYQLIYGKVMSIRKRKVEVSIKLCDVWNKDFHSSLILLDSYLKTMTHLVLRQKGKLKVYNGKIYLNCPVKGIIEEVKENHAIVRTENGDLGIAEGKFEQSQTVQGRIVWIDCSEQIFYVKTNLMDKNEKRSPLIRKNDKLRGKVVFINKQVIVLELRGRGAGELAFLPQKRHLNDIKINECVIKMGEELKLWITRKNSNYFLAMDCRVVALQEKTIWKKSENKLKESVKNLKKKLESEKIERLQKRKIECEPDVIEVVNVKLSKIGVTDENPTQLLEVKEEKDLDNEEFTCTNSGMPRLEYDDVDIKSEADVDENENQNFVDSAPNEERIELSSSSESEDDKDEGNKIEDSKLFNVGFNWEVLNNNALLSGVLWNKDDSSSSDEGKDSKYEKKKRRRLTAIEKKEKAKSEEERLRLIEERLMDTEREPESADDFDRAVLSNPNSSALWLKYMAFHIQGTEIEKARAVAKRALKAISFREEQEKLNIWIALLNLENMYGNEDSLKKITSEALQSNEPYKIHLHLLNIYGQSNRLQDMEKLGNFMLKKYKDVGSVWCDVALAYFCVGKVESARNVLQRALTAVNKNQHIPLISKFAQMENKYGSPERAQTLYESILASFPKRVDIWCCYVDMLVKSNHIELARQVLERAISQSLRPRKMKTLFKKFISFEEIHGNAENVEKVREAAVEYVQTVGSLED